MLQTKKQNSKLATKVIPKLKSYIKQRWKTMNF